MTGLENMLHNWTNTDNILLQEIEKLKRRIEVLENIHSDDQMAQYLQLLSEVEEV